MACACVVSFVVVVVVVVCLLAGLLLGRDHLNDTLTRECSINNTFDWDPSHCLRNASSDDYPTNVSLLVCCQHIVPPSIDALATAEATVKNETTSLVENQIVTNWLNRHAKEVFTHVKDTFINETKFLVQNQTAIDGWRAFGISLAIGVGASICTIMAIPVLVISLLCCLGFTVLGVRAASCAAGCHSCIGNVESGSCFACLQSAGATSRLLPMVVSPPFLILAVLVGIASFIASLYVQRDVVCALINSC